ncbi:MAG: sulfotransferase domain-containing protein [Bacteroidales bacterium]|nr:sulfotransferase domain-containing protein [Bacteroidales bacterium]
MLSKNLIWLVSYPKSGNTWVRIFLANYLSKSLQPVDINKIKSSTISSSRKVFDRYSAVLSSDLKTEEIDNLRPHVYIKMSEEENRIKFIKTHDAYSLNDNNLPIFPTEISKGVIHIVRHPLDVAVSFAFHSNISIEKSIQNLNNHKKTLASNKKKLTNQLRQVLDTWSNHYLSWENAPIPRLLIRYEDLLDRPEEMFKSIVEFCDISLEEEKLLSSIKHSSFNQLKTQEDQNGFREKPIKSSKFFRSGKSGAWQNYIPKTLALEFYEKNVSVMKKLGYYF